MEDLKMTNAVHTMENGHDVYTITFEFNKSRYSHIKEQLIIYYLLQAVADEIEDIAKIREVINNDDYFFIEHPTKYTSIIELLYRNNKKT